MKKIFLIIGLIFIGLSGSGCKPVELTITGAWSRPGYKAGTSGIFFNIENPMQENDVLVEAKSTAAKVVELHQSSVENGVMKMTHLEEIDIPAKTAVEFKPGSYHVMLINLVEDLSPGDTFELILVFKNAGEVSVSVPVEAH